VLITDLLVLLSPHLNTSFDIRGRLIVRINTSFDIRVRLLVRINTSFDIRGGEASAIQDTMIVIARSESLVVNGASKAEAPDASKADPPDARALAQRVARGISTMNNTIVLINDLLVLPSPSRFVLVSTDGQGSRRCGGSGLE
jgi:hypothetical protein